MKAGQSLLATIITGVGMLTVALPAYPATGDYVLVRDGRPAATVVLAEKPTRSAAFAAWEIQYHVKKITGAELPLKHDGEPGEGLRLLVGESAATRELGLRSSDLKPQEYMIRFARNAIVIMGRDKPEEDGQGIVVRGKVEWAAGRFGKALKFSADGGAVVVSDCGFSDGEGSMEAWVWVPEQPQQGEGTVLRLDGSAPWTYHIVRRLGRRIVYVTYDGKQVRGVSSGDLAAGWHHVLATHSVSKGKIELFIDGVSQGTAAYSKTTCKFADLRIGGLPTGHDGEIGNPLVGLIDEVRISRVVRRPMEGGPKAPEKSDADTTLLLHLDEGDGVPRDSSGRIRAVPPPGPFDEQGTSYAAHDFLERFCDVRWYGPTELGLVCPKAKTLAIRPRNIRRKPALAYRFAYPLHALGMVKTLWDNPSPKDMRLFWARLRLGGEPYACNHSFYGYYDRYWARNPQRPQLFVEPRPEWFAKGYKGRPPQMCYTNRDFIRQVIRDARDYFDRKGLKPGAQAMGDYFALVPMDNNRWCKCPACQAEMNEDQRDNPHFSNGFASDYVFGFVNKVARAIGRSHPDKFLSAIAYHDYAYYPRRVKLEPNVSVQMCLHVRNWWAPDMERNDMHFYREWVRRERGRRLFLWLYYCFPEENGRYGNFNCFPGFFAHTAARQIKMFARDGIRGAFLNGLGEQVDTYITFKLFDDPSLNVDELLDEFFARYYGAAGLAMKRMYSRIEEIFSNPANYPDDVRLGKRHTHQTEEIAWGYLGTKERMRELGRIMRQAKRAARTDEEKRRVALFEEGVWKYMVEGSRKYEKKREGAGASG